jgi:drug/metabolite transporter (DMT)-like permease
MALSFAILGETLSLPQLTCIALVLAGILVVSMRENSERGSGKGVPYAVACMLSAGLNSVLIKLVSMDMGEMGTLFFNRVLVTLVLLMVLPFFGNPFSRDIQRKVSLKTIFIASLTEFAGFFGFIVGVSVGVVSIIAADIQCVTGYRAGMLRTDIY